MSFLGGIVSGIGSIVGGSMQASAARKAANAQVQAAQIAANTQRDFFNQSKSALTPYMDLGNQAAGDLGNRLNSLTAPIAPPTMDQSDLEATPGYQFTLSQGLKAVQQGAAARGLGVSGAAQKGAAAYATGLSDQTYNTRFSQAQTQWQDSVANQQNAYNKLFQTAGLGGNAADALAGFANKTGAGIAQSQTGAGSAQAAGINAAGQATAAGLMGATGAANNSLNQTGAFNNALNQYLGGGNSGGLYTNGSQATGGIANLIGKNYLNGGF